jgi:O-antigen biosynthesis protein
MTSRIAFGGAGSSRGSGSVTRITVDGKQFAVGTERFHYRGATYGTFRPRPADGALFPPRERVAADFAAMARSGFSVVRTYTPPPADVLDLAAEHGLRLQSDVFWPDWRFLVEGGDRRAMARTARRAVRDAARRLAGREQVLALSMGNEIPADAIRWFGARQVAGLLEELAGIVRDEAPELLVTYANYPSAEYLPLESFDFLTFNVYLERQEDLRRYLSRLHHICGDRPLVLGEIGLDSHSNPAGERRQADVLDWHLSTSLERGVAGTCIFSWTDEWWVGDSEVRGWHFGLTRADRTRRPALGVAERWNTATVADLRRDWPGISVVVCAYNAAATLDECLLAACALDYPDLEVILVDDGSADATAAIAERHAVRVIRIEHAGLGTARNEGLQAATKPIVAYLDSDAYPSREWPYYLALAFDEEPVGAAGGPNVPPPEDPPSAHRVARAPGGPVHVLLSDDRAEHVPGCNMAVKKSVLEEIGGFDPIYTAAGDDVDVCWRVLDRGYHIGFHPAALVWHHRRAGVRAYLRQQRGYGRSEALVEARHPDRFTALGTARWRGRIYDSFPMPLRRQRIYRGMYGAAAYQSVYGGGGHVLDLVHQVGMPLAIPLLLTAPFGLVQVGLYGPAAVALVFTLAMFCIDAARFTPPARGGRRLAFRLTVALLHVLQPLVRSWARLWHAPSLRRELTTRPELPQPAHQIAGDVWLVPAERSRPQLARDLVDAIRARGVRTYAATGWEASDARLGLCWLATADLLTSAYPVGWIQVQLRTRLRRLRCAVAAAAAVALGFWLPLAGVVLALLCIGEATRGVLRARLLLQAVLQQGRRPRLGAVLRRPARYPEV